MNTRQKLTLSTTLAVLLTLTLLLGSFGATALAAQSSLPGDALYMVKTSLEETRVELARDPAFEADLHLQFAKHRLDEMTALIQDNRLDQLNRTAVDFQTHIDRSLQAAGQLAANDPIRAQQLNLEISAALARYAQALSSLLAGAPDPARPAVQQALNASQRPEDGGFSADGEQEFTGIVETLQANLWVVDGIQVRITPATEFKGQIQTGDLVKVHATPGTDGVLVAREIEPASPGVGDDSFPSNGNENEAGNQNENTNESADDHDSQNENEGFDDDNNHNGNTNDNSADDGQGGETRFTGLLQAINGNQWTISGLVVTISPQTEVRNLLQIGDQVEVRAVTAPDGSLLATRLERPEDANPGSSGSGTSNDNTNANDNQNAVDDHGGQDNDDSANQNDDHGGSNDNDDDSSGKGGNENENGDDSSGKGGGENDHGGDDGGNSGSGGGGNENGDDSSGKGG